MNAIRFMTLAWVTGLLVTLPGCSTSGLFTWKKGKNIPEATAKNPAVEVLCIWQPAEGRGLDGLPTRGFAGQILFFSRGAPVPVKVNGDVRIYLFDDVGTTEEQAKPIHQFDFKGEAWTTHLQDSTLGPSYNVFIPYVKKHPYQAQCSLRVRLTPSEGPVIYSETANITLPGPSRPTGSEPDHAKSESSSASNGNQLAPEDEALQQQVHEMLQQLPGTIPTSGTPDNGKPKTVSHTIRPQEVARGVRESQSSSVKLASAEVEETEPSDAREQRLQRIEAMLAHLLEEKSDAGQTRRAAPSRLKEMETATPAEDTEPPRRFRLAPSTTAASETSSSSHRTTSDSDLQSMHYRSHPLAEGEDDDFDQSDSAPHDDSHSAVPERHPLEDFE